MAYTTVNKSTDYFNTKLYTGNGGTNAITGVGFQPDLVWGKSRSDTFDHFLLDAVRGTTKIISSNTNVAESTQTGSITAFDTDGFTLGSGNPYNKSSDNYASWNWKAGGGQGSSNTDGSINTTYTSVSTISNSSLKNCCMNTGVSDLRKSKPIAFTLPGLSSVSLLKPSMSYTSAA